MPALTVRAVRAVPVEVPLNFVLGTSQDVVRQAPLLLIDLETEEGVTGRSWLFCYLRAAAPAISSLLEEVERVAKGEAVDPEALWAKLTRRFTLIGVQGIVRMALAGFDVACWDALAIAAKLPLARFLGAESRAIPAYNSCGLGLKDDLGALAAEAERLLAVLQFLLGRGRHRLGRRTQVSIPLMRDGRAIGAISAGSMQVDGISDSQVALLQTFAEQAVIAIGSAETYRALQTRTGDLQEFAQSAGALPGY